MNNNIFQHNSSCVLGVTFSLTLEKAMVGDLGKSLCLKKYWFCSLKKETLVSYYNDIYVVDDEEYEEPRERHPKVQYKLKIADNPAAQNMPHEEDYSDNNYESIDETAI